MKREADEFFYLKKPYEEILCPSDFWQIAIDSEEGRIENLQYSPDKLISPEPPKKWRVKRNTFVNFSFAKTHISYIEFTDCIFENCLFVGSTIIDCRFNNCKFVACNFFRSEIINCYIDPSSFFRCTDKKKHANIGLGLYQELLHNSRQQAQPDFTREAQFQFVRWKRYFRSSEIRESNEGKIVKYFKYTSLLPSLLFEKVAGSGVRLGNIAVTSVLALTILTIVNYYWSASFGLSLAGKPVENIVESFYFSTIVVTSLGFGDITPSTDIGRIIVALEAIIGFVTFATLISMIFRRITS